MRRKRPKISIITPSHNQGSFLAENIQSIQLQDYSELQHIIIDGGSNDQTVDIIKEHQHCIDYWVSEPDNGQSHAINKGLKVVTGDIITWLNCDDLLCPDALSNIVTAFSQNPDCGLIYGRSILFGPNRKDKILQTEMEGLKYRYFAGIPFAQPSAFFKREVINKLGYLDETLHFGMDYDFFIRIALNYDIISIEHTLSKYRLHEGSKTYNSHCEFGREWAIVFSRLLQSIEGCESIIKQMKSLDLYTKSSKTFAVNRRFEKGFIEECFKHFLLNQIRFYYEGLDLKTTKKLTAFLKEYDASFYYRQMLHKVHRRSQIFPKNLFKIYRTVIR